MSYQSQTHCQIKADSLFSFSSGSINRQWHFSLGSRLSANAPLAETLPKRKGCTGAFSEGPSAASGCGRTALRFAGAPSRTPVSMCADTEPSHRPGLRKRGRRPKQNGENARVHTQPHGYLRGGDKCVPNLPSKQNACKFLLNLF